MKEYEALKLVCFNDLDVIPFFDRATTKFAVTQPSGSEKVKMAPITERRNLWNWLPDLPNSAVIANQLLSMHTTAGASDLNRPKWSLVFAKNRSRLSIQCALQMIFLSEKHVITALSEVE